MALILTVSACRRGEPARTQAPADSAEGAVSFELAGPGGAALMVPVTVNGQGPFDFVLDTGATLTCLNESLADSLGLEEAAGMLGVQVSPGGRGGATIVQVDSLRVGAAKAFDLRACTLDLSAMQTAGLNPQGLLGLNFLQEFRVELDFERNVVHLIEP